MPQSKKSTSNVVQVNTKKKASQPKKVTKVPKQNKNKQKTNKALKQYLISQGPQLEISPQYAKTQDSTPIYCSWYNGGDTILEVMIALNGYLLSRNISATEGFSWNDYYNGLVYLFKGLMAEVTGNTILDKRPRIVNDLISALSPKTAKFGSGEWSFAWDFTNNAPFTQTVLSYPWGQMPLVQSSTDGGRDDDTYKSASPAFAWGINNEEPLLAYNKLLLMIQGIDENKNPWLKTVTKDAPSVLSKDVSAFARTYAYGENAFYTGGAYNDVECEAVIHNPDMSHFCPYGNVNSRYPTKNCIHVSSGSASMALSPLLTVENGWFNKTPAVFHYVDFYDIVNRIVYWYIELNHVFLAVDASSAKNVTLPFTFQDFCVMVRQAVLSLFPDQWAVSAISPGQYNTKSTNFVPFTVNGHCFASNEFSSMLLPQLIVENLAALQSMVHVPHEGAKYNKTRYIPVLGIWDTDSPNNFTFNSGNPVFKQDQQDTIELAQCRDATNAPTFIDANGSFYVGVKDTWNTFVSDLKGTSTNIMAVSGITPCNMPLAVVHRIVQTKEYEGSTTPLGGDWACTRNISNLKRKKESFIKSVADRGNLKRQSSKEVVTKIVLSSQDELVIRAQVSKDALKSDVQNLMQYLILPSIRLGSQNSSIHVITEEAAKTMLECPHSLPMAPKTSNFPGWLAVQKDMGQLCVTGFGREATSTYNDVMNFLESRGHAGLLGNLLGGAVKAIIPGSSGVVDTLASIFPF